MIELLFLNILAYNIPYHKENKNPLKDLMGQVHCLENSSSRLRPSYTT